MRMETAKEIRQILNEIDYYNNRLREIKNCVKLDVTICDGYNGKPITYQRDDIEVKAIIKSYERHIEDLKQRIQIIEWVKL